MKRHGRVALAAGRGSLAREGIVEIGVYTFGDTAPDPLTGRAIDPGQRLRDLIEEAELADQVGLDVFGVGEHHRADYAVPAPAIVLAAAAQRTKQIRLTSAVSVISSDDPVRLFEEFAMVDLLSGGRVEIMAGRGSFIESFPLFGYDLEDYDVLFADKLELLLKLREGGPVTWDGAGRAPLDGQVVSLRPEQERLPVWIAVGGNPQSVVRAGRLGLPLAVAIIGGAPARFAPLVELYRESARQAGHDVSKLPVSINSQAFVGDDARQAADDFFPAYAGVMTQIGRERGWPPTTRAQYEGLRSPQGALLVGNAEQVIEKILYEYELFRHDRFLAQISMGALPHRKAMRAIELLGTEVAPVVRREIAARKAAEDKEGELVAGGVA